MKRWLQMTTAALLILMLAPPAAAAEASFMKPEEQDGQAQEQEMRILELAEQYTPDQAAQWKEELAKRAELREQLHKYKNSKKYRKKQEEIKQELKQKLDSGEMTQEDLKKMKRRNSPRNTAHGKKKAASCSSNWNKHKRKKMSKRSLLR